MEIARVSAETLYSHCFYCQFPIAVIRENMFEFSDVNRSIQRGLFLSRMNHDLMREHEVDELVNATVNLVKVGFIEYVYLILVGCDDVLVQLLMDEIGKAKPYLVDFLMKELIDEC